MTDATQQLYRSEGPDDHTTQVLSGERAPANEYELQERLKWQYYKQQKPDREDLSVETYVHSVDDQQQAHDIWVEHGMENAFRSLLEVRRAEAGKGQGDEDKTAPTDEPKDENLSSEQYVPGISLDDVMRRRAERQAG